MESTNQKRLWKVARISAAVFGALLLALHVAAVFTESVNWDEFSFLFRGTETLRTGVLDGGGRPGLAVLPLLPIVSACDDGVSAARIARLLWVFVTLASVLGLFYLLRNSIPPRQGLAPRWHRAAFAVAFLVLVPVWLRWSLQIRTDQWALALTMWGGVLLLASKERPRWLAGLAGALMMFGFLATQKGIYLTALVGVVTLGHHVIAFEWRWKRELARAGMMVLGAVAAYVAFEGGVRLFLEPYTPTSIGSGLDLFKAYERWLGFRIYEAMVPTLWPHIGFLGVLVTTTLWTLYERIFLKHRPPRVTRWQELLVAWVLFLLGLKVMYFHTAAFPYFWLTLGLFPAAAIFFTCGPAAELVGKPSTVGLIAIGMWGMLAIPSLGQAISLTSDTQKTQRTSLDFVERNFAPEDRGFHPESALLCRDDPDPFPTYFTQHIISRLQNNPQNQREFIREFRERPVKFIIPSYRLSQFPKDIQDFWRTHYVNYSSGVKIPGFMFAGKAQTTVSFDSFVDGTYRWRVPDATVPVRVIVDGEELAPNEDMKLTSGLHQVTFLGDLHHGVLVYKVQDDWDLFRPESFYSRAMRREFEGM